MKIFSGNTYSRRHISLNPNDPKFWDFSWHEIGIYDIPATIDYILQQTNQTKLSYVGHSQGVTAMYVTYLHTFFVIIIFFVEQ